MRNVIKQYSNNIFLATLIIYIVDGHTFGFIRNAFPLKDYKSQNGLYFEDFHASMLALLSLPIICYLGMCLVARARAYSEKQQHRSGLPDKEL